MLNIKNSPQDIAIKYGGENYKIIEDLLNKESSDVPLLLFMLALLGLNNGKKISLEQSDGKEVHNFSIRTMYNKYAFDFDTYIGLIAILDNKHLPYDEVVNKIAFERTGTNDNKYFEMKNVRTFFEYVLGGIDEFINEFFIYGKTPEDLVSAIHDFLQTDLDGMEDLIQEMITTEEL